MRKVEWDTLQICFAALVLSHNQNRVQLQYEGVFSVITNYVFEELQTKQKILRYSLSQQYHKGRRNSTPVL